MNEIFIPMRGAPLHIEHQNLIKKASQQADLVKILLTHASELDSKTPIDIEYRIKLIQKTLEILGITNYELATCSSFDPNKANKYIKQAMLEYGITKDNNIITWTGNSNTYEIIKDLGYPIEFINQKGDISATNIRQLVRNYVPFDQYSHLLALGSRFYRKLLHIEEQIRHYGDINYSKYDYFDKETGLVKKVCLNG